jgi:hypothetical protein
MPMYPYPSSTCFCACVDCPCRRQAAYVGPRCRECGGPTYHMGDICYGCDHKPKEEGEAKRAEAIREWFKRVFASS